MPQEGMSLRGFKIRAAFSPKGQTAYSRSAYARNPDNSCAESCLKSLAVCQKVRGFTTCKPLPDHELPSARASAGDGAALQPGAVRWHIWVRWAVFLNSCRIRMRTSQLLLSLCKSMLMRETPLLTGNACPMVEPQTWIHLRIILQMWHFCRLCAAMAGWGCHRCRRPHTSML